MTKQKALKNKKIYGVSSKYVFRKWNHGVIVFDNMDEAEKWLYTEGGNFAERELVSKSEAIRLTSKTEVHYAEMLGYEI